MDAEGLDRFQILLSSDSVRFETPFGLAVEYDGLYVQTVMLPEELSSRVTGLCGNFNDVDDEKILPDGTDHTGDSHSDSLIGQYYQIDDPAIDTYVLRTPANLKRREDGGLMSVIVEDTGLILSQHLLNVS